MPGVINKLLNRRSGRVRMLWQFDAKANLLSPPLIADIDDDGAQEVVVSTTDGRMICLDAQGRERWTYSLTKQLDPKEAIFLDEETAHSINTTPACADLDGDGKQELIVGTERGEVLAINHEGKQLWRYGCDGPVRGGVITHDINDDNEQEVLVGSSDGFLHILSQDGRLIHKFDARSPIESTPEVLAGRIHFGCDDGTFYALEPTGEVAWTFKTDGPIQAKPLAYKLHHFDRHYLLVGSRDYNLYALDQHGNLEWSYATQGAIMNAPAAITLGHDKETILFVGSCDNCIHALSAKGERLWTYETDFWIVASPTVVDIDGDGRPEVIAGSYDHNLYILDCEGEYQMDYLPGVSGVVQQTGHYTDLLTQEAGSMLGKRLWQLRLPSVIIGCEPMQTGVLLSTRRGHLVVVDHTREQG